MIQILIFLVLFSLPQESWLYNKQGRPSSAGIAEYVDKNYDKLIWEYNYLIKDSIQFDLFISVEDLREWNDYDSLTFGWYYYPDQIILTNEEKYIAYEIKDLSKFKKWLAYKHERTVQEVLFHEFSHAYLYQIIKLMDMDSSVVSRDYTVGFSLFPRFAEIYGADFIEEGICQYIVNRIEISPPLKDVEIPKTQTDLFDNEMDVKYHYSIYFLKLFLDQYEIKEGIEILLRNPAPSYKEILDPDLYFNRLN